MALSHAMLSLLMDKPQSGYDLAKNFSESISFFWKATHQQIYRELAKLEEQNLVTVETIEQDGRPDKKLYSITEAGKTFLAAWLLQPGEVMPIKEDLLVKLWASDLASGSSLMDSHKTITALRQEFHRHRQLHAEKLATYEQIEQKYYQNAAQASCGQQPYRYLVLRRGIRYEQDYIAWCDEVLTQLELELSSEPLSEPLSNDSESKPV